MKLATAQYLDEVVALPDTRLVVSPARASGRQLTVVRGACPHDCPDTCAWEVTVEDGRAVGLRGVKEHPLTQGRLCAKVNHYLERVYSPDRVLHPLRRVGAKGERSFEQIGWDDALDEIASRLGAIVAEHGGEAVLPYSYMGTQGIVQSASLDRRFFSLLGATRLRRGICGSSAAAGYTATQGGTKGMLPEDLRHSRFIVLWGTNTIVTNLHLWPFITEARANGARIVVIDPVETRTARSADWHVRPRPGTDAALALGLMHVIVSEACTTPTTWPRTRTASRSCAAGSRSTRWSGSRRSRAFPQARWSSSLVRTPRRGRRRYAR